MHLLYFLFLLVLAYACSSNNGERLQAETIVGGTKARKGDFKYVAAIMYKLPGSPDQNPCTASILGKLYIATVAHCFYDSETRQLIHRLFYVVVGLNNIKVQFLTTQRYRIDKIFIHKNYDPYGSNSYNSKGNLAIAEIDKELNLLPSQTVLTQLFIRQQDRRFQLPYIVAAFGYDKVNLVPVVRNGTIYHEQNGNTDGILKYAKVQYISNDVCSLILQDQIAPGNMCAKTSRSHPNKPVGICKYDSGAPLVHHSNFIDGIAINGFKECDEELKPGIYLNLTYYSDFISNVMDGYKTNEMYILQLQMKDDQFIYKEIK